MQQQANASPPAAELRAAQRRFREAAIDAFFLVIHDLWKRFEDRRNQAEQSEGMARLGDMREANVFHHVLAGYSRSDIRRALAALEQPFAQLVVAARGQGPKFTVVHEWANALGKQAVNRLIPRESVAF